MPGLANLAKYGTIKKITKSFRTHPVHGYTIECWHFDTTVDYSESRRAPPRRRGRGQRFGM